MAVVKPGKPRGRFSDTPAGLEFVVPAKRNLFAVIFLSIWLVFWAFGWAAACSTLVSSAGSPEVDLFLLVWLAGWTAGGALVVFVLAWSLAGREIVTLRPGAITIARRALGIGRSREYNLAHVSNLRVSPEAYDPSHFRSGMRFWGLGGGRIAFDYGASTVRFGATIEEGEAAAVVERLVERQPALLGKPAA